jgi:hypothetical protein
LIFFVLAHGWVTFLFSFLNLSTFFALYGRVSFTLLAQRKVTKRKGTRMLALRVPCDAQSSRRDMKLAALRQHIPKPSAQSPLLGKPERD